MRNLTLCLALISGVSVAQVSTVEASAESAVEPLQNKEDAKARALDRAQKQALRNAVERAAGVYIQADSQTRNNVLVLDRVLSNASGYVKSFEVVSKSVDERVAKIAIKAQVSADTLDHDIKAARQIVGRLFGSKLLIVVQEQLVDEKGMVSRSEYMATALTNRFKEAGFTIIDEKGTGNGELGLALASGVAQGKLDEKTIARKGDADYILYGTTNVRYVPPDPKAPGIPEVDPVSGRQLSYFVTGDFDLAFFNVRTGQQLSKQAGRMTLTYATAGKEMLISYQRSASYAVESSAKTAVPQFFGAVFEFLRDQDVNGARLTVHISGIPSFDEVEELEKALGVVEGVKTVKAGEFANGKADFGVQFLGNSADFGKALKGARVKKKKLVVTAVRSDVVEIALQ